MSVLQKISPRRSSSGLTFLEVLLGISMLALLLVGATTAMYSFSRAYFTLETGPQFQRHADGVSKFLQYMATFSESESGNNQTGGFLWLESPVSRSQTLAFRVDRDIPFFVTEHMPLPSVTAYLEYDEDNSQFWLSWHVDPAFTNRRPQIRHSLLSQWAGDIEYGYFDEEQKTWEIERASSDNRSRGNQRPDRIILVFDRDDQILRRELPVNQSIRENVLVY